MNDTNANNANIDAVLRSEIGKNNIPSDVQQRLDETYRNLSDVPQVSAGQKKIPKGRRGLVVLVAAALTALLAGGATAATRLLEMGTGNVDFFESGSNIPVYDSMEDAAKTMSADVGESVQLGDLRITVDSISCDRSIANVYLTMSKEGGIDVDAELKERYPLSSFETKDEWSRISRLVPYMNFTATSYGEIVCKGAVRRLDAYQQDGQIKVLTRLIMEKTLPEETDIELSFEMGQTLETVQRTTINIGLDLSSVTLPKELEPQVITFPTSQGEKHMKLEHFAVSELGTVMAIGNETQITYREDGNPDAYITPDEALDFYELKLTDSKGNILNYVDAGDGVWQSPTHSYLFELAGVSPEADSVTFTPMLFNDARDMVNGDFAENKISLSEIPVDVPISEYGGYRLTNRTVSGGVDTLSLKPYGWIPIGMKSEFVSESSSGPLSSYESLLVHKWDYETGECLNITSYYTATDEEISTIDSISYRTQFGRYSEEADAAQTLDLA